MQIFKQALRRIKKKRSTSLINTLGLSISLSVCLVILLYCFHHFSFDRYVDNAENTYRLISRFGDGSYNANTMACFEDILKEQKEVTDITACYTQLNQTEIFAGEKVCNFKDMIFTDDSFLKFFGSQMIQGNPESINQPDVVFLTPTVASNLFPDGNALGKSIQLRSFTHDQESKINYTVAGIIKPLPETSHINYEILVSKKGHFNNIVNFLKNAKVFGAAIYTKILPATDLTTLANNLNQLAEPKIGKQHGPPLDAFNYKFQALNDIHFNTDVQIELKPTVRKSGLYILLIVGGLIFFMSVVNFINLLTADGSSRATEFGIIRFLGGKKTDLWLKMTMEVFIIVSISFVLGLIFISLLNKQLSTYLFSNWSVSFNTFQFRIISAALFLVTLMFIFSILGFSLSKLKTAKVSAFNIHKNKVIVPLMVFQYVIVIGLVGFSVLLSKQLNYINTKSLGYNAENVMIIESPERNDKVNLCINEFKKIPGVINAAHAHHYPMQHMLIIIRAFAYRI